MTWIAAMLVLVSSHNQPLPGGVVATAAMVPMRDNVKLSVLIFTPPGKGPWPVLLEQRYASVDGEASRQRYARLAAAGFVVAAANFRGSQKSEGTWVGYRALGWGELKDGYDLVEWLARQPWSTGKIGTFGGSQAGFAQNFLAVTRPAFGGATHDRYWPESFPRRLQDWRNHPPRPLQADGLRLPCAIPQPRPCC